MGRDAHPRILILTLAHGAAHRRAAQALAKALVVIDPLATVETVDALAHCARWFRAYYDSYLIPLRYFPALWRWIESVQHQSDSTGPAWLYRRGGRPLFRFIRAFDPDVVVATEVGVCELAAMCKRESKARFRLAGMELMDFNQAWVQPEVDLYLATHVDLAIELEAAGAPRGRIIACGQPIDPVFASPPDRDAARARLGIERDLPLVLVLFGGAGFGKPRRVVDELRKIEQPFQAAFIAGRNDRLKRELEGLSSDRPRWRVLGWVDNIQEWMAAADLMVSKPGGATLTEGFACGLPMLAFDPLPGNEQRTCGWIEKWQAGRWVRRAEDLAPTIARLFSNPEELSQLRERALALARPRAAFDAAEAVLRLCAVADRKAG